MTAPTEQDHAVARRVLRRIAGRHEDGLINVHFMGGIMVSSNPSPDALVYVDVALVDAAISGACAGREYRVKELKADADAAHARVEGRTIDRQIAHLTKGSK